MTVPAQYPFMVSVRPIEAGGVGPFLYPAVMQFTSRTHFVHEGDPLDALMPGEARDLGDIHDLGEIPPPEDAD